MIFNVELSGDPDMLRPVLVWGLGILLLLGIGWFLWEGQSPKPPKVGYQVEVQSVISGDTLEVLFQKAIGSDPHPEFMGQRLKVRLIGIDAPERGQTPWGKESQGVLGDLIGLPDQRTLMLSFDRQVKDTYDRILAYGWKDKTLINQALVQAGQALVQSYFPNVTYEALLRDAQVEARLLGRGLWNAEHPLRQTPSEFRQQS